MIKKIDFWDLFVLLCFTIEPKLRFCKHEKMKYFV